MHNKAHHRMAISLRFIATGELCLYVSRNK